MAQASREMKTKRRASKQETRLNKKLGRLNRQTPTEVVCATTSISHTSLESRLRPFNPLTEKQDAYYESMLTNKLTFAVGSAGTGKTKVAASCSLMMLATGKVNQIILTRPCQEAGERLGAMPGGMKDKVGVYMVLLLEEYCKEIGRVEVDRMLRTKIIDIVPLAFMRGYNFDKVFCVLDEAQNATKVQMKMFLTRACEDCRMVVDGDFGQIDINGHSGLSDAVRRMTGDPEVGVINFTPEDVVRSGLVRRVVEAYDRP